MSIRIQDMDDPTLGAVDQLVALSDDKFKAAVKAAWKIRRANRILERATVL